jgi:ppGpp synthetase/RelA/SpoT-type nucleotidyltranferase
MDDERFQEIYDDRLELYDRAIKRFWECTAGVRQDFREYQSRPLIVVEDRVKESSRLKNKAVKRNILDERQVFEEIEDIAGVRLVTYNVSAVFQLHDRIKSLNSLEYKADSFEDYINNPKESGYRAVHFVVYCKVDFRGSSFKIPCEVQIRSIFQHSWALLSELDIYKNDDDLPLIIRNLSRRLADQLAVLDDIAQDIRDELATQIEGSDVSDETPITKEGLAKIYQTRFGGSLSDYQAQVWMNSLAEEGAGIMRDAKNLLPVEQDIARMREIYQETRGRSDMPRYHILRYGPRIVKDPTRAFEHFRAEMQDEYQSVMGIGKASGTT